MIVIRRKTGPLGISLAAAWKRLNSLLDDSETLLTIARRRRPCETRYVYMGAGAVVSVGGFLSTELQNLLHGRIRIVESSSGVEIVFRLVLRFNGCFAALVLSILAIVLPISIARTALTTESNDELLSCILGADWRRRFLIFGSHLTS